MHWKTPIPANTATGSVESCGDVTVGRLPITVHRYPACLWHHVSAHDVDCSGAQPATDPAAVASGTADGDARLCPGAVLLVVSAKDEIGCKSDPHKSTGDQDSHYIWCSTGDGYAARQGIADMAGRCRGTDARYCLRRGRRRCHHAVASPHELSTRVAVMGIVVAAAVNSLVKGSMATVIGGRDVGLRVGMPLLVCAVTGLLVAWLMIW